jgi:hypothetical protein
LHFSLQDVEEDGELGDDSSGSGADRQQQQQQQQQRQRGAAAAEDSSAPLLDTVSLSKKAGFRDAGFIFAPRKGWWAGLGLVVVSLAVMTITVLTTE